ncbi:tagaturonate reductase [Parapedobacter sp. SGR-10]|uniref:tagaturonate reductase n=1 Tax=Parapedobacter sp. SGR-10 TaxID=2710879 RepID=UPI0013D680AE|nr:tagaturonate reductase [Parapedobacter sp. SGR-10]NGF57426.1 tagaturonate reductase [Parapedobacter sp. SGR-10]
MLLSKENLANIKSTDVELPTADSFLLPERVLQFGTGVLLRGLPDYFIDKANKQHIFNGRIIMVKSTDSAGTDAFQRQDNLYTLCIKGIEQGKEVENYMVNNSISRVLSARQDWPTVLETAHNPDLRIVISNTTEAGITLSNNKIDDIPPSSYPGKLLAFLYKRYQFFQGAADAGLVILPTELISDNAGKLKEILLALTDQNDLEDGFKQWLTDANHFCNTLVDRIVPGRLPKEEQEDTEQKLGYEDQLMIMAEPFRLWAIESTSPLVKETLSFAQADSGIVIVPSIEKFKELKLRLLNGTHTLSCGIALLAGIEVVKQAMSNDTFSTFVRLLMQNEIGNAIIDQDIKAQDVTNFSSSAIDRFSNPFLDHRWENIALNFSSKMNMRAIPLLDRWYQTHTTPPTYFAMGFAAYLTLMNTEKSNDQYSYILNDRDIILQDELAPLLYAHWQDPTTVVQNVLRDRSLWDTDLTKYAGLAECVQEYVDAYKTQGILETIQKQIDHG